MFNSSEVLFLLNPESNERRAFKSWQKARARYPELPQKPALLPEIDNLERFIRKKSPKIVAIAGGDGSINSLCSSVVALKKQPAIAVLPFGFGNVMSLCLGTENLKKAMEVINQPKHTINLDLIKTNISEIPYSVFMTSVGYDARIVHLRMQQPLIGFRSYFLAAIQSFFDHRPQALSIVIDKHTQLDSLTTSLVVANGPIIGGNLVVSPRAKFDDGFLDCTIFPNKYSFITNFRFKGIKHPFYSDRDKVYFKAKHLKISGEPLVQIDGDPATATDSLELEVLPKAVTFLRNKRSAIDQPVVPFSI